MSRRKADSIAPTIVLSEQPTEFLSTGSSLLDFAISEEFDGGIAVGRTTQLAGDESTGKSMVAAEIAGAIQRKGGKVVYCDIEGTLDLARSADLCGMDTNEENFKIEYPESIEQFWDEIVTAIAKEERKHLIIVDSLSALKSKSEEDGLVEKNATYPRRAKIFGAGYRKYQSVIRKAGITFLFISQTRENPNVIYGSNKVTDCGKALKFYSSTIIMMENAGKEKDKKDEDVVVGRHIKATITKNKIAPPDRTVEFNILFEYGIDDIESLLRFRKKNSSDTTFFGDFRVLADAVEAIEHEPKKYKELKQLVYDMYIKKYKFAPRKRKHDILAEVREG